MYEAFFNLKHKPFSLLPDPDFLYLSSKHALALSLLEYCLSGQAGFCVITGEIGSGKTTLVRAFLNRIGREFTVGIIANTHSSLQDVSAWALNAFGQKSAGTSPAETYQDLMSYLIAEYGEGRQCILIVDEAQNLTVNALEELRLLSNINSGKDLLLQIVLIGQPELLGKLKRPELIQFAQRIAVSHHLAPLPYAETREYIEHRLRVAGADHVIFSEMAIGAVQYFSGGVPRLINSICDLALVYAFAEGVASVTEDIVFRVVADRQISGIAPFARSESAEDPAVRAEIAQLTKNAPVKPREAMAQDASPPAAFSPPVPANVPVESAGPALAVHSLSETPVAAQQTMSAPKPRTFASKRDDLYFEESEGEQDLLLTTEMPPETPAPRLSNDMVVNGHPRRQETVQRFEEARSETMMPRLRSSLGAQTASADESVFPSVNRGALSDTHGTKVSPRRSWWRRGFAREG